MKKTNLFLVSLLTSILMISCDNTPCDDGYTQLDNGICVPDYIVGIEQNFELGNVFYHSELGIITYNNGIWYDKNNFIIKNITD